MVVDSLNKILALIVFHEHVAHMVNVSRDAFWLVGDCI